MADKLPLLERRTRSLLKAAELTLLDKLSAASGYSDPGELKLALIEALHRSPSFRNAALALHGPLQAQAQALNRKARPVRSQTPRPAHAAGRVQASRRDPSLIQKDRLRGARLKGGRRTHQAGGSKD